MEEDRLSELFAGFEPDLSSDNSFMRKVENNLEAVELVKQRIAELHRRSRLAMIVAAVTGFVFGIIIAALYPLISGYIAATTSTADLMAGVFDSYGTSLTLTAICACGFTVTYAAYDITLAATNKSGITLDA